MNLAMLEIRELSKRFGGMEANSGISLEIHEGEIVGLVGPNGAGKTTLFDLITCYYRPDAGSIHFRGESIVGLQPHQVNRKGIARTFQILRPFVNMTTFENAMVAALPQSRTMAEARKEAERCLELVGLSGQNHILAKGLSTGQRKRLEMAKAMATHPKLLLLDEVTGGVDPRGIPELVNLMRRLREEGATLLVIEHNMKVIMSVADRIIALHLGKKIADGTPEMVTKDREVIQAYLGAAYA
jgi:branched-chain amino acid transport system ATP-binding protein